MAIEIFSRREQKYLVTRRQYEELITQLAPYMRDDKNGINGRYTVSSLYFDNPQKDIYFETKNKVKYRQKLRLRIYGEARAGMKAYFEVKQKHNKVVHKRRLTMKLDEAYRYLAEGAAPGLESYKVSNPQVLREIEYFRKFYGLEPEMVVSYDRHALHGLDDPDLRMTFDLNLRCRRDELELAKGAHGEFFIDPGLIVLEVKVDQSVPLWLARILQALECEQRSSSKFCTSTEKLAEEFIRRGCEKESVEIGGGKEYAFN